MRPLLVAMAAAAAMAIGQPPEVSLRVVAPEPDAYVSGITRLKVAIDPPARAADVGQLVFFADGKQVCNVLDIASAECTWDAGPEVRAHVLRVVAVLHGGTRVVTSARTKGLDHVEAVSVDVVQLTAVVGDKAGRFVPGLTRDAFRVYEDNVPQRLAHFSSEGSPLEIVVVNTRAGSRYGQPDYVASGCGMGYEATMYLLERGVRLTGTDA